MEVFLTEENIEAVLVSTCVQRGAVEAQTTSGQKQYVMCRGGGGREGNWNKCNS